MKGKGAPFFYVVVGAPGAGKSSQIHYTLRELHAPRQVIFDIEGEYSDYGLPADSTEQVRVCLLNAGRGPVRITYKPRTDDPVVLRDRFGAICQLAFAARDVLLVVDELADVDSPNPSDVVPAWATLLRRGRKRGVAVLVGTQRPADVNKRIWSFATRLRVGRLQYSADERELAGALKVDRAEVAALLDTQWIERDRLTGALSYGSIAWKGGHPVNLPRLTMADEPARQKNEPSQVRAAAGPRLQRFPKSNPRRRPRSESR